MNIGISVRRHSPTFLTLCLTTIAVITATTTARSQAQDSSAVLPISESQYCSIIGIRRADSRIMIWHGNSGGFSTGTLFRQEDGINRNNVFFAIGYADTGSSDDVVGFRPTDTLTSTVWTNNCNALHDPKMLRQELIRYGGREFLSGDATGDGMIDIVAFSRGSGNAIVWTSTGANFTSGDLWLQDTGRYDGWAFCLGDATGDHRADLVGIRYRQSAEVRVWSSATRNDGSHYFTEGITYQNIAGGYPDSKFFIADMNGDDTGDVVAVNQTNGNVMVITGPNFDFARAREWRPSNGNWSTHTFLVADADGDHLADIIVIQPKNFEVALWRNTGTALQEFSVIKEDSDRSEYDFYISRPCSKGDPTSVPSSKTPTAAVTVHSASGEIATNIVCRIPANTGTLMVADILGRNLHCVMLDPAGISNGSVTLPALPAGIYLLCIEIDGQASSTLCYVH